MRVLTAKGWRTEWIAEEMVNEVYGAVLSKRKKGEYNMETVRVDKLTSRLIAGIYQGRKTGQNGRSNRKRQR